MHGYMRLSRKMADETRRTQNLDPPAKFPGEVPVVSGYQRYRCCIAVRVSSRAVYQTVNQAVCSLVCLPGHFQKRGVSRIGQVLDIFCDYYPVRAMADVIQDVADFALPEIWRKVGPGKYLVVFSKDAIIQDQSDFAGSEKVDYPSWCGPGADQAGNQDIGIKYDMHQALVPQRCPHS
jgi:hypothetical protein